MTRIKEYLYDRVFNYKYQYLTILCIYALAYLSLSHVFFHYEKHNAYESTTTVQRNLNTCAISTYHPKLRKFSKAVKGNNYRIDSSGETDNEFLETCIVTTCNIVHLIFYLVLALLAPDLWPELLAVSIGFEVFEYIKYDCHDYTDPIHNAIGVYLGYNLRRSWLCCG